MAVIRNGQVVSTAPWWHLLNPMKLLDVIMLFFQTLVSPESASQIRLRKAAAPRPTAPRAPPGQANVRTLGSSKGNDSCSMPGGG
mmetsp:Transcript_4703/g.13828  ORF Transcript_4703/g.13828 Transcript_4703/m.13828 type:complete len:85 (+) Transcript_4703:48-302(+)|eukprot:CAMPEP_0206032994 /NCGR_PEP_ID=MMETSP1466-20131121/348_1 /ASSEMBLY_ACC=CAM_ASM_001126 /TAXON_ID=44452 /ORGANISM="Pavlova gyrans, Strain CCMP608" /LENGTH=84 /DNA_ID=CAMNT_0053407157 /DNA_START=48 /DNA_END=302 /DNA_ORIENTATION=+